MFLEGQPYFNLFFSHPIYFLLDSLKKNKGFYLVAGAFQVITEQIVLIGADGGIQHHEDFSMCPFVKNNFFPKAEELEEVLIKEVALLDSAFLKQKRAKIQASSFNQS